MDPRERWFEDHREGDVHEFGDRLVTAEEIIAFARQFDPQPFHLSEEGGRASPFGGLIASGWHTASIAMRLWCDHALSRHGVGSPGLDELKWPAPVRPGDRLRARATVIETRRSRSRPEVGIVRTRLELFNQRNEQVCSWTAVGFVRCRDAAPPPNG